MTMNPEDPPFAPDSQDHESGLHTAVSSPIDVFFQSESPYPRPPSSELDVFDVVGYRLPELEDQPACGQDWTTPGTPGDGFPSFAVFTPPEDMTSPTSAEYAVAYDQYSTSSLPVNGSLSDITLTQDTGLHSPLSYASISPSLTHSTHFDRTSGEVSPSSFYNENSLPGATLSSSSATMDQVTSAPRSPSVTPDLPYAQLIYRALMSVPDHTMSLKQIYEWIQKNTSKSSTPGRGWQNSIRHNLSMNAAFKKQEPDGESSTIGPNGLGGPAKRSTNWVLEPWAVTDGVQSTTRYRRVSNSRRIHGRGGRYQQESSGGNYVLVGQEDHDGHIDRASAGRRGGFASRQSRARRQNMHNQQQQSQYIHGMPQQVPNTVPHDSGWTTPRSFAAGTADLISGYHMHDHFRGGHLSMLPQYGITHTSGGVYGQSLPASPHNTSGLSVPSESLQLPNTHISSIPMIRVSSSDPRTSSLQHQHRHLHHGTLLQSPEHAYRYNNSNSNNTAGNTPSSFKSEASIQQTSADVPSGSGFTALNDSLDGLHDWSTENAASGHV